MRKIYLLPIVLSVFLSGCQLKSWQGKTTISASDKFPNATEIQYFKPDSSQYDKPTLEKIVSARRIIIETNDRYGNPLASIKWLRANGARGMIDFHRHNICVSCSETNVYLIP